MKVLVAVKSSGYLADDFTIADGRIDSSHLEWDLNENDDYAIEEAALIKDELEDVEVVAVTIGPFTAMETIKKTLAKGADRAIRIWDSALDDLAVFGPDLKGELLGAVVAREEPDLVLTGVQSDDDSFGATGVYLASLAGYQWATIVRELEVDPADGVATVHRELEGGIEEIRALTLPAVVTVQAGINEPTYVSRRKLFSMDRDDDIDRYSLDDLELAPEALTERVRQTALSKPERAAAYIEGDTEDVATQLVEIFRDRGVVQ